MENTSVLKIKSNENNDQVDHNEQNAKPNSLFTLSMNYVLPERVDKKILDLWQKTKSIRILGTLFNHENLTSNVEHLLPDLKYKDFLNEFEKSRKCAHVRHFMEGYFDLKNFLFC